MAQSVADLLSAQHDRNSPFQETTDHFPVRPLEAEVEDSLMNF
jgi:hypothetical protein